MVGRLLVSLAVVLGVMWLIARRARKGVRGRNARVIEVLDRASLSRGSSVAVVRVNDRAFVLGIAESQVSILGETDLAAAQAAHEEAAPARGRRRAGTDRPVATAAPAAAPTTAAPTAVRTAVRTAPRAVAPTARITVPAPAAPARAAEATRSTGPLAGSALSPQTWKQTIESLRDLTARP
ncbi:flagellar protein FliO/FliZ [Jatrophihabitans endophyticus]|uniref:Flagellar protein n=2 Tax=Jatrophihabitans endophyticus TaxID=1206085 RepID=A0A1M5IGK1_9ACTN|nr:flagellar protein FliO/FliZ [Jatrophihabitans endophyticus]